jgi:hypothetical protein
MVTRMRWPHTLLICLAIGSFGVWAGAHGTIVDGVMQASTSLLFVDDNTYDIGASGVNRPRDVYVAGRISHNTREAITVNGATTFAVTSTYITLACTGAETINTITGGITGMRLYIEHTDTDCTIADDDDSTAANAVNLVGTATDNVGSTAEIITLVYMGTHWIEPALGSGGSLDSITGTPNDHDAACWTAADGLEACGDDTSNAVFAAGITATLVTLTGNLTAEDLLIEDSNASHYLTITTTSDLTAARTLTLVPGDAARTITLSGDPTLADWFDQDVQAAASPTFAAVLTGLLDPAGAVDLDLGSADITDVTIITDGGTWVIDNGIVFPDENDAPTIAGELKYDNTVTGLVDGAMTWYDDDEIRRLVDIESEEGDYASGDDGHQVTFNWNSGNGYFDLAAPGSGSGSITGITGTPTDHDVACWTGAATLEACDQATSTISNGLTLTDSAITNVTDIALDTISSDESTTISVTLGTDAGDDFIVGNNSNLVVTGDNDRIGSGTAAPGAKFEIRKDTSTVGMIISEYAIDSDNPIAASGIIIAAEGAADSAILGIGYGNTTEAFRIFTTKTRASGTNANTIVNDDDLLFSILSRGADGASFQTGAFMGAYVDGTPGSADMPSRWEFHTTRDGTATNVEALQIDQAQNVEIYGTLLHELNVEVVTTTKTTTLAESNELYTNTGDGDGSTITLLNDPTIGAVYTFVATAAQTITVVASSGETIESSGSTCATSVTLTDGQSVTIVAATAGSGAQWHVIAGVGFTCNT